MALLGKNFRLAAALPAAVGAALIFSPAAPPAAAAPSSAQGAPALPPQKDKPPLSEEEIFPNLGAPGKNGAKKPAAPAPQAEPDSLSLAPAQKRQKQENLLFTQLKREADPQKAAQISRAIEGLWAQSGSETVDLLMQWADKQIAGKNYPLALDFLDNAIALAPDYAEGWMRRASVHLMDNDIALAMAEMQYVLQLNPRQYNAMLQLGAVFEMTDRPQQALAAYQKALALYPQLRPAQRRVQALIEDQTGRAI